MQKHQIFFLVAILGFPGAALAQTIEAPPIKMGLWQTTTTSTMSGMQIPPDVAARMKAMGRSLPTGQPRTTVTQSCATPEKWKEMFQHLQRQGNCALTNEHLTSSSLTADVSCKSGDERYNSTGNVDIHFESDEKIHGKVHVETNVQSQPQPIVSDMSFESAYQGADCQGVSPDAAKVIR
ncbi:MAG TPA: DUF3617 domain-containing protein [Acidobacteriaceae bacterium]|nr:DUF3617 domain-containing protein [Acidobacteriaceae bacterium]